MMKKAIKRTGLHVGLLFSVVFSQAQRIATFEMTVPDNGSVYQMPIRVELDPITALPDSVLSLFEIRNRQKIPVAIQIEHTSARVLHWIPKAVNAKGKRTFELHTSPSGQQFPQMIARKTDSILVLGFQKTNLLQYNHKPYYPPAGVDTVFKRSGFIHPLWSPKGETLTRISPWDHYHHFGLWNPWTKILYRDSIHDLWNLNKHEGTVRFANFVSVTAGNVFAEFQVVHDHVAMMKDGAEQVIMHELQTVRAYRPDSSADFFIADITIQLNCAEEPVVLKDYHYGSLGFRATEEWNKDNSRIFTSEGKSRKEADGTRARWYVAEGKIRDGHAGLLMMSYPTNFNHPEPLRVWPEAIFGRGDVYTNFVPVKGMDWPLEPGKNYVLKYRLLVYDGKMNPAIAESSWKGYTNPLPVKVKVH